MRKLDPYWHHGAYCRMPYWKHRANNTTYADRFQRGEKEMEGDAITYSSFRKLSSSPNEKMKNETKG